jgi:hypothetical protein
MLRSICDQALQGLALCGAGPHLVLIGGEMSIRRFVQRGLPTAALTVALTACGGAGSPGAATQQPQGGGSTVPPGATAAGTPAGSGAGPVTGHVGDKLTFTEYGGAQADGTLVKVLDPVHDTDQYPAKLPAGTHWVGVELTLDNHSPDYMNEASQVDATTSAGATIMEGDPANGNSGIDGYAGCTPTDAGNEQDVQPFTHCYGFVVPDGQTLTRIGVKVGEVATFALVSDQATWTVP